MIATHNFAIFSQDVEHELRTKRKMLKFFNLLSYSAAREKEDDL